MQEIKETSGFESLGIAPKLLATIKKLGLVEPTPIQQKAIPHALAGQDLIGIAQTGTGKTLAFSVPMLERLALYKGRGLVLLPTRELAAQVEENIKKYGADLGIRTVVLIGGESIHRQFSELRRNPHIIIGTPGRVNDHLERRSLDLSDIKVLVLDEADMMLDMGFAPQIEKILRRVPKERQTMLFSATMPTEIISLANTYMRSPIRVEVAPAGTSAEGVDQEIFIVHKEDRINQTEKLLQEYKGSVLIFCRTKHGVKNLTQKINLMGQRAAEIHSNRSQEQRRKALAAFKNGQCRILVATDIAARGIDVSNIELVLNFDLPDDSGDYVHRIGRTARAGKTGKAISFATPDQGVDIRQIERLIKKNLPLKELAKLEEPKTRHFAPRRFSLDRSRRGFQPSSRGFGSSAPKSRASAPAKFSREAKKDWAAKPSQERFKPAKRGFKASPRGFEPDRYFSSRPETRIMTDKERFRAGLREAERQDSGRAGFPKRRHSSSSSFAERKSRDNSSRQRRGAWTKYK